MILSGDNGFDPLVRHMAQEGYRCRRIGNQFEWLPLLSDKAKRFVDQLAKVERSKRPRKRKTLRTHVNSRFNNTLPGVELDRLVGELFDTGLVSESGRALTYSF